MLLNSPATISVKVITKELYSSTPLQIPAKTPKCPFGPLVCLRKLSLRVTGTRGHLKDNGFYPSDTLADPALTCSAGWQPATRDQDILEESQRRKRR
ncbi:hypothetical protein PoB_000937900 [Plakobranchus ocellatus]|uniref:Uncharacterized protein n=1 Tax=Plakobranchus ocellatus TaxID=259542 RepID=A0AAV3YIP5_9GAST|nr:hypothetical protein PoB_000937900 [Plakobranchus ocellatus]